MATINIKLNAKSFPVQCEDSKLEIVSRAAEMITQRFEKMKSLSPTATTEYLLMLCALSLQGEALEPKFEAPEMPLQDVENILEEIYSALGKIKQK